MRIPGPNLKIKIVLPVSLRCALLNAPTVRRLQDNNQTARQQTSLKVPKWVHLLCPAREITEKYGIDVSWKNEIKLPSSDLECGVRQTSSRFIRSIVHPRLVRNPIHFPGLAAILRERLFKVRRIRVGVRPNKSNEDRLAIERVLGVKLAAAILKFAYLGNNERAVFAIGPREAPLVSLGIV